MYVCVYTNYSAVERDGILCLTVKKSELKMTGFFLDLKSYFVMFPQAGLFINTPALVTIA